MLTNIGGISDVQHGTTYPIEIPMFLSDVQETNTRPPHGMIIQNGIASVVSLQQTVVNTPSLGQGSLVKFYPYVYFMDPNAQGL
jgi:hypothetical protein